MMLLWAISGVPFGAYAIIQNFTIPIQLQSQIFMAFSLISYCQVLYYGHQWPVWKAALLGLSLAGLFAGIEAGLIFGLRVLYNRGNERGVLAIGIIASILLAVGLLPPYGEIYKRRGRVVGINFLFLSIDWCGAVFSLMALVAQNTFDVLGGVLYIICAGLELGIFLSHAIWMIRTYKIRKAAKAEGKTFDDIAAEHDAEGRPFAFAERKVDPRLSPSYWYRRMLGKGPGKDGLEQADEEACTESGHARDEGSDGTPRGVEEKGTGGGEEPKR